MESGWIDLSENHRLLVHDWPEHCEQWVKLKLKKLNLDFAAEYRGQLPQGSADDSDDETDSSSTAEPSAEATAVTTADGSASRDQAKPSLAKPRPKPKPSHNPAQPSQAQGASSADAAVGSVPSPEGLLRAWNETMGQSCELTDKRLRAVNQRLRDAKWVERWEAALERCSASDFCGA